MDNKMIYNEAHIALIIGVLVIVLLIGVLISEISHTLFGWPESLVEIRTEKVESTSKKIRRELVDIIKDGVK